LRVVSRLASEFCLQFLLMVVILLIVAAVLVSAVEELLESVHGKVYIVEKGVMGLLGVD